MTIFDRSDKLELKGLRLLLPGHPLNGKMVDLQIKGGQLKQLEASTSKKNAGHFISPGWIDVGATLMDPGDERSETLTEFQEAAMAGGYTRVGTFSNQDLPVDDRRKVNDLLKRTAEGPIQISPIPCASKQGLGQELVDFLDISELGICFFMDTYGELAEEAFLMKSMQYSRHRPFLVGFIPGFDRGHWAGHVNDSPVSVSMGLRGIPTYIEEENVRKIIRLAQYYDTRVFVHLISCSESLQLIRDAKKSGLDIRCSVGAAHLLYTNEKVKDFDPYYKVLPPLRTSADRKALIKGVLNGDIDIVCSTHFPQKPELKDLEFTKSSFGISNIQSCFSLVMESIPKIGPDTIFQLLVQNPSQLLSAVHAQFELNEIADYTIFSMKKTSSYNLKSWYSGSANSPVLGHTRAGSVEGTIFGHHSYMKTNK